MGFERSGSALIYRREIETAAVELPIVTIQGRDFALSIRGWRVDRNRLWSVPWWTFELMHLPWRQRVEFLREFGITGVYAVGLEVATLRLICTALASSASTALMEVQPTTGMGTAEAQTAEGFYGSVMPDGSLLGIVSTPFFDRELRTEAFRL
jgi:hypothetical protein